MLAGTLSCCPDAQLLSVNNIFRPPYSEKSSFSKKGAYKYIPALSVIKLGLSNYTYATLKQHVLEVEKQMIVEAGQFLDDLDAEIFLQFVRLETNTSLVILVDSYVFESFC